MSEIVRGQPQDGGGEGRLSDVRLARLSDAKLRRFRDVRVSALQPLPRTTRRSLHRAWRRVASPRGDSNTRPTVGESVA